LRIRAVVQRLRNAVTEQDRDAFLNHADALLLLMHQHSEKEEGILYPMIERALGPSAQLLVTAMERFGCEEDDETDRLCAA
jgi:hemerythrin-like domain-containing protein